MSRVSVIIVTYNSAAVVRQAIASVVYHPAVETIMVVDNASTDATVQEIKDSYPAILVLQNSENSGFGRANNLALRRVSTGFALLLNPDAMLQEGALDALLLSAEATPDAAILAPQLLWQNGEIWCSYKRNLFRRERSEGFGYAIEGDICAEFLSGAVWLVRMDAWRQVGFFDERIFLFYEDDDMCLRVRNAGYSALLVYDAKAVHLHGKSTPYGATIEALKQFHLTWSRLYMEQKYYGHKHASALRLRLIGLYSIKWLTCLVVLRFSKARRHWHRARGALKYTVKKERAMC